jgi:hypothetical protein
MTINMKAELKKLEKALRKHATETTILAEQVWKILESQPSNLDAIPDSETIHDLLQRGAEKFPEDARRARTRLQNCLRNDHIDTVSVLRQRMLEGGRPREGMPHPDWLRHIPNLGRPGIDFLAKVIDAFDV